MEEAEVLMLRARIREQLDLSGALTDEGLLHFIEEAVFAHQSARLQTSTERLRLVRRLYHAFRGLDALQPLMEDATVSEIMINAHDEVFIERDGRLRRYPVGFESRERLEDIIQGVVAGVNRVVNESSPIVDARLKDGSRVHIVLPPVALKGPTMTIRKFPDKPLQMDDLIRLGALPVAAAELLGTLVQARLNIFISGGTGSGKTTFLNALAQFIPSDERIITIEDSAELQIRGIPNLVSLETRNANTEGKGEITMRDLIRASLRMRPNRIIVGEVRGGEALDMLQAMNTGHSGSISTGHANSTRDMLARLETMVLSSGAELPVSVIRRQVAAALDIVVHLARMPDKTRRVTEISEVIGMHEGEITLNPLFGFKSYERSEGAGQLVATGQALQCTRKLQLAGLSVSGQRAHGRTAVDQTGHEQIVFDQAAAGRVELADGRERA